MTVGIGEFVLTKPILLWINDGLMAIFFLVVGVEIKRELLIGELNTRRKAALPIAAAVGGAVLPAAIFALIVGGGLGSSGWGIPMATDIAFALGVLALLGSRVPVGLRIFLTALAIVDDLMAVLVIAVFYTYDLHVDMLVAAAGVFVVLLLANRAGVRHPIVYAALGILLWIFVLKSGVHATIAGVLLAATIPARVRIDPADFVAKARAIVDRFEQRVIHDPAGGRRGRPRGPLGAGDGRGAGPGADAAPGAHAPPLGRVPHRAPLRARQRGRDASRRTCSASRPTRSSWASSWASWWASRSASPPPPGSSSGPAAPRCRMGSPGATSTAWAGWAASASRCRCSSRSWRCTGRQLSMAKVGILGASVDRRHRRLPAAAHLGTPRRTPPATTETSDA